MREEGLERQLSPGDRIGDSYTVERPISRGAMGAVYAALGSDGDEVAIKQLVDPSQSARFEIEARLLKRLSHPRVVKVIDYFQDQQNKYLVMDLVRGMDLAALLRERGCPGLPTDEAVGYVLEACEALQYVHDQNVVHRDVKPQNLVLGATGVILVDFGIAREFGSAEGWTQAVGTPQFMAPEILVGETVSPRSDVYSLAATLWTLLVGKPPSYSERALTSLVEDASSELEEAVRSGLELRPERRLGSAAAFVKVLGSPIDFSAGRSLALSMPGPTGQQGLIEAIVRTAAGIFEAAAASIALVDTVTGELVYRAAWGAGAEEIVGVRLPLGTGIAGAAAERNEGIAVPSCRDDARFAAQIAAGTGYVPHTMLAAPLERDGGAVGVLSVLDRRDGKGYHSHDLVRASLFADLIVAALPADALELTPSR